MPKLKSTTIIPTDQEEAIINAGIASDPDTSEMTDAEFAELKPVKMGRPKLANPKKPINIRLSQEVVDYFKGTGKGWQTRVNQVLKEYIAHQ